MAGALKIGDLTVMDGDYASIAFDSADDLCSAAGDHFLSSNASPVCWEGTKSIQDQVVGLVPARIGPLPCMPSCGVPPLVMGEVAESCPGVQ